MTTARWYSRESVGRFVLSTRVQNVVIAIIFLNAVILGLETIPALDHAVVETLHIIDKICLGIFVVEIAMKLYAHRLRFFTNAWNVFDFLVVGISLIPGADGLAVLRALRVLRVLRLISAIPALRRVVDALVRAVPGIASIAALLVIIFYVGAVMATILFGPSFPATFGDLGASLFSLFQIMTLDNWSVIARDATAVIPWAPAFFVPFVLISALTVLNLFIAVIVDAMQGLDGSKDASAASAAQDADAARDSADAVNDSAVLAELALLRGQIAALTAAVGADGRVAVNGRVPAEE